MSITANRLQHGEWDSNLQKEVERVFIRWGFPVLPYGSLYGAPEQYNSQTYTQAKDRFVVLTSIHTDQINRRIVFLVGMRKWGDTISDKQILRTTKSFNALDKAEQWEAAILNNRRKILLDLAEEAAPRFALAMM